jgi:hypothetical protein
MTGGGGEMAAAPGTTVGQTTHTERACRLQLLVAYKDAFPPSIVVADFFRLRVKPYINRPSDVLNVNFFKNKR